MTFLLFGLGLVALVGGADLLVRGASRIASSLGTSPLVIGLTVVAFGTSSPEFAVTIGGALGGRADIAVGNVVGSNILNVLLILGLAAAIAPLVAFQRLVRIDVPVMIACSILLLGVAQDGSLGRAEGALFLVGACAYTGFLIRQARRDQASGALLERPTAEVGLVRAPWLANLLLVIAGLAMLVAGARTVVDAAASIARTLGVSELVIGLTVVALGTSLPELATSVVAAVKGERDISVGNVVGSNIYNILAGLGGAAIVAPTGLTVAPSVAAFDLPFMVLVACACLPIFFTGYRIARWEGVLFLGYYVAYSLYVVLSAAEHELLQPFSTVLFAFALPLTFVTLAVLAYRSWRRNRSLEP